MIDRHMKQARRVDNGKLVQGYYIQGERGYILTEKNIYNMVVSIEYHCSCRLIEVDSATVEDVAIKPIKVNDLLHEYNCPYCGKAVKGISVHCIMDYCANCGQRIDWSGEDGE